MKEVMPDCFMCGRRLNQYRNNRFFVVDIAKEIQAYVCEDCFKKIDNLIKYIRERAA